MLDHTSKGTFADSTSAPTPTKMSIDFLVSTNSSEVEEGQLQSTVDGIPSPPAYSYPDQQMPCRGPRPHIGPQSYPSGPNAFTSPSPPGAPPYLEPTTQPYWVQDAGAAPLMTPTRSRLSSVSSAATSVGNGNRHKRAARPKYDPEMAYFIWFHRTDLGKSWDDVKGEFNKQFPNNQSRALAGIQSKFYRVLKDHKVPDIRQQRKRRRDSSGDSNHDIGFREWITGAHYDWMDVHLPGVKQLDLPTAPTPLARSSGRTMYP